MTRASSKSYPAAHDGVGMTLKEIGFVMGISRQRVRQIEKRALTKLRSRPGRINALMALSEEWARLRAGRAPIQPIFDEADAA